MRGISVQGVSAAVWLGWAAGAACGQYCAPPMWEERQPAFAETVAAYDAALGAAVLSMNGPDQQSRTWLYDGAGYRRLPIASPPHRVGTCMAYDPDRRVVVLVGGRWGAGDLNDHWEFDGEQWRQRTPAGDPLPPLSYGAMAYDTTRHRMVLCGGYDDATEVITWTFDGEAWTRRPPPSGLGFRTVMRMAYDSDRDRMVLFSDGGTWEFNGSAWSRVQFSGLPGDRLATSIVYNPLRRRTVMFGGILGLTAQNDVLEWDGRTWTRRSITVRPGARSGHAAVWDSARGVMEVLGGQSSPLMYGALELGPTAWTQPVLEGPASPMRPLNYDALNRRTLVYDMDWARFRWTLWSWSGSAWAQVTPAGATPPFRDYTAMATDLSGNTLIFGGLTGSTPQSDAWVLRTDRWEALAAAGPEARYGAAMTYDSLRRRFVLFGGARMANGGQLVNDTWVFDLGASAWTRLEPAHRPEAREFHAMCYDPDRDRVVMLGGGWSGSPGRPTWEFDGTDWIRSDAGGPAVNGATMSSLTYDAQAGRMICWAAGSIPDETKGLWAWDGSAWSRPLAPPFPNSTAVAAVYDAARRRLVTLDSQVSTSLEMWEMATPFPPEILHGPADLTVQDGGAASFAVDARGNSELRYQWRRDGETLAEGGTVSGSRGRVLRLSPVHPGDAGRYDVVVSGPCGEATSPAAELRVRCLADFNGDFVVDLDDLAAFVECFETGKCGSREDLSADGFLDFFDYMAFMEAFKSGC